MQIKNSLTSSKIKGLKPDKGLKVFKLKKRKKYVSNSNKK